MVWRSRYRTTAFGELEIRYRQGYFGVLLDDTNAEILSVKLNRIDGFNNARIERAGWYSEFLKDFGIKLPYCRPVYRYIYYLYLIDPRTQRLDGVR